MLIDSLALSSSIGKQLKRSQGPTEGIELSGFRVKTGEKSFSQAEVLAESVVSLLSAPPSGMQMQVSPISESPLV